MSNLRDLINREEDYSYNYSEPHDPAGENVYETKIISNDTFPDQNSLNDKNYSDSESDIPVPRRNSRNHLSQKAALPAEPCSNDTIVEGFERIKTHFPAARIKKIMQSDEEIGKVAQATPVIVGRALEIFMSNLIQVAVNEAKSQGVRRISTSHIRAAVEHTEQFDFLVDAVSKYPSTKPA